MLNFTHGTFRLYPICSYVFSLPAFPVKSLCYYFTPGLNTIYALYYFFALSLRIQPYVIFLLCIFPLYPLCYYVVPSLRPFSLYPYALYYFRSGLYRFTLLMPTYYAFCTLLSRYNLYVLMSWFRSGPYRYAR